jgi:hypothetical protein
VDITKAAHHRCAASDLGRLSIVSRRNLADIGGHYSQVREGGSIARSRDVRPASGVRLLGAAAIEQLLPWADA